jgi:hypothetical protein
LAGVHKFAKNLEATSKLYVLARRPKTVSTLRSHSSAVSCESDCNVELCAQRIELIHIFVGEGNAEIIRYHHIKFCCQSDQVPRICASM